MNHIALNRPRSHDGHFDDEVIEITRLQTRQHRHLRTRLDLKHTDRISPAQHVVDLRILRRYRGQSHRRPPSRQTPLRDQIEYSSDRRQHAEREQVHLEQTERIEIVFVPLNDCAVDHTRILDRYQLLEQIARDHETADML